MGELNNIFSDQLRKLCETKGSISKVAMDLSINRQQFARYLNGTSIPREAIIERLAEYFSVSPSHFFMPHELKNTDVNPSLEAAFDLMRSTDFQNVTERELEPGFYLQLKRSFCTKNVVIRGLAHISYRNGVAHYKSIRSAPPSFRPQLQKRLYGYSGIFVKIEQNFFLVTKSRLNGYISLHCLNRAYSMDPSMKSGVHFTLNSEGFLGVRSSMFLLTKIHPDESVLDHARNLKILNDEEVSEFEMDVLNSQLLENEGVIGN